MFQCKISSVLLLLTVWPGLPSGGSETISKSVCLGDSVQLFQNVSLTTHTIVIYHVRDRASRKIGTWSLQGSVLQPLVDKRYEGLVYLDEYRTIWMRKIENSNEGKYSLVSTEHSGSTNMMDVEIMVMEAPGMHCKPQIKRMDRHLLAGLEVNDCGRPAASIYWSRNKNQDVIELMPGKEAGAYHACIKSPSLICARKSKATDYCSSFIIDADEELIPDISIIQRSIDEISIVLLCKSNDKSTGKFSWRQNGKSINNKAKYSQKEDSLTIRYLKTDDQYDIYTCMESGSRFESYPYSIEMTGPILVKVNPMYVVIKEHNRLNISCLTDCYPLCSFQWHKLDPSDGQNRVVSDGDALEIRDITRVMSGNYTCKVQNIITGALKESFLSLNVLYGPDDIVFNTSNNIIEMDEFESTTILSTAECFPPCRFGWTETYSEAVIGGADLKIFNVKEDSTYTCHATNPKLDNATISETIMIKVKFDAALVPRIEPVRYNALDISIVLQCISLRVIKGRFSWRVNGVAITNHSRYSEDNVFLVVRHLTAEDQNNLVTCIEPGSGFQSDPFWLKTRGPNKVVFNTSNSEADVYQFSSVALFCSADCFPPCLFRWTFSDRDTIIDGAELKIFNVTSNGSLTCIARNPINMNVTASETINIMVKSQGILHVTTSTSQAQVTGTTSTHIPSRGYLIYITPGIAGVGLIACVTFFVMKKSLRCHFMDLMSDNNQSAQSDISTEGEGLQVETISEHYWTVVTNARGEPRTALDRNINLELGQFIDRDYFCPMQTAENLNPSGQNHEEDEAFAHTIALTSFEILESNSNHVESNGYISPIHTDTTRRNEYIDQLHSDPVACNQYIHPVHSDPVIFDEYTHHINSQTDELSHPVHPVPSDPGYTDNIHSYRIERDGYINILPSEHVEPDIYIDNIPLD